MLGRIECEMGIPYEENIWLGLISCISIMFSIK